MHYPNICQFIALVHLVALPLATSKFAFNISLYHCVKSVQIRGYFWPLFSCIRTECRDLFRKSPYVFSPNTGKYGPAISQYLDTFRSVMLVVGIFHLKLGYFMINVFYKAGNHFLCDTYVKHQAYQYLLIG